MKLEGQTLFLTGAAGGIGQAFIRAALDRGCTRIYAADLRLPERMERVEPLVLDITDPASVDAAAASAQDVTLLINNAGVNLRSRLIGAESLDAARREMEVNYFGNLTMCRAFAPVLARNGGGTIVNMLSILAKVTLPNLGSYCASKAALLRLCEGARAELAPQGTRVVAVMPWAVDTPMSGPFPGEKTSPEAVAEGVLDALATPQDDIYFHTFSDTINTRLRSDPEALVRELGATFRSAT